MSLIGWIVIGLLVAGLIALIMAADYLEKHPPDPDDGTRVEKFDD